MFQATFCEASVFYKIIKSFVGLATDINMKFTPSGISISAMDQSHVAYVTLELRETAFVHYYCTKSEIIGLSLKQILSIMENQWLNNQLTLQYNGEKDFITLRFQSQCTHFLTLGRSRISEWNLDLKYVESEQYNIPEEKYTHTCTILSKEYGRVCQQFTSLGCNGTFKISLDKQSLTLSALTEFWNGNVTFKKTVENQNQKVLLDVQQSIFEHFSSDFLHFFAKGNEFESQVKIQMGKNKPIKINYKILNGEGYLTYYLAPILFDNQ